MKMLYHIGDKRFIIKNNNELYIVSLSITRKSTAIKIDEMEAKSIMRQGYWQEGYELKGELKNIIISLIKEGDTNVNEIKRNKNKK